MSSISSLTWCRKEDILSFVPTEEIFFITDRNISKLYPFLFSAFPVFISEPGEERKTAVTVLEICQALLDAGISRHGVIVAIGGGITCDIAGFAAAIYMRGIRCIYMPTSLLAMTDAALGGKTGVNFGGRKNILGTFSQPASVLADPSFLATLPEEEWQNGLAEIIKHALIRSCSLYEFLTGLSLKGLMSESPDFLKQLITQSADIKKAIVQQDEKETHIRKILNLGHTLGHALEATGAVRSHGHGVSVGIAFAAALSEKMCFITSGEKEKITSLLLRYNLPIAAVFDPCLVMDAIRHDKKRTAASIEMALLEGIGKGIVRQVTLKQIEEVLPCVFV